MADKLILNAEHLPLGRLAAYAAKQALLGKDILIANCEKAVILGSKKNILADYKQRRARGAESGPFFSKTVENIVKRAVRGMLEYKKGRGLQAFKKIRYIQGNVEGMQELNTKYLKKTETRRSLTIQELSRLL